jgi:hypothetical protein
MGNIYVADEKAVLEFGIDADGNVPPKASISGDETGLTHPTALAIGPGDK